MPCSRTNPLDSNSNEHFVADLHLLQLLVSGALNKFVYKQNLSLKFNKKKFKKNFLLIFTPCNPHFIAVLHPVLTSDFGVFRPHAFLPFGKFVFVHCVYKKTQGKMARLIFG